jgi:hypothetical protein
VGSSFFVKQHKAELPNIVAQINLDCIGSSQLEFDLQEPNTSSLDELLLSCAQDLNVPAIAIDYSGVRGNDLFPIQYPSRDNQYMLTCWHEDLGISDASTVNNNIGLASEPLDWIHTPLDTSFSTKTSVSPEKLEEQIKVAALATLRLSPSILPSAPQSFKAVAVADGVKLTWKAPLSDGGSAILYYNIYKGVNPNALSLLQAIPGGSTSYTDTAVNSKKTYYYMISAVNSVGEGTNSGVMKIKTK